MSELAARLRSTIRAELSKPGALRRLAFPNQRSFLDDRSKMRAALCTRRAGKSFGAGLHLFDGALEKPGTSQLYVALTRESAKRIMHKDVLRALDRRCMLDCRFNETSLDVVLPNGSTIYLLGVDAKPEEQEKILGQKFYRVVVDECASFRQDLKRICYGTIRPALTDLNGTLSLIGTPGNVKGFFHDVTTQKENGWSVHRWTAFDNPHIAGAWTEEIASLERDNPGIRDTALFRQMYLGEWVVDESRLVYRYSPAANDCAGLPEAEKWHWILALDLGYEDDTAVVIAGWRPHDATLYVVFAEKRKRLTISAVAEWVQSLRDAHASVGKPIASFVVDGAAKQAVEELRQRYKLPLEAADKTGKADVIAMMNADLQTSRIQMLHPHCAALAAEYGALVWDERAELKGKRVESAQCENHLADAALYAWRYAKNYLARAAKPTKPDPRSEEAIEAQYEREARESRRRSPIWERDAA